MRNQYLDELLNHNVYFLIGEKGTGKIAYATYLGNNNYKNTKAAVAFLSSTDYEKFYALKKNNNLELTDYAGIWRVILLLLLSKQVKKDDIVLPWLNRSNFQQLIDVIDEYYMHAFSPEIANVMRIMDESKIFAELFAKHFKINDMETSRTEFSETRFQHNLYYIEKHFKEVFEKLKLNKDIVLFVDGIDIRPDNIPYEDYITCIRGLVNAVWYLNTVLFSSIRDSRGRFRIVLLLRPDIFNSLNLQNAANKLMDNSVFLDWYTTYQDYKNSFLYKVAQRLLSYRQQPRKDIFEDYFPWKMATTSPDRDYDSAFMEFLKISLSRPRDVLVIMQLLQKIMRKNGCGEEKAFDRNIFAGDEFQNRYSEYFVSSLKDQLSFYYSSENFENFLNFFNYFKEARFEYADYLGHYEAYLADLRKNGEQVPGFFEDGKKLLQLLYSCNVIAAVEVNENGKTFFHFSYREKDSSNINPKVPTGDNVSYRFHYGLYKKNKMGRYSYSDNFEAG